MALLPLRINEPRKGKARTWNSCGLFRSIYPGSDLLSHAVAHAVPSALEGLTSVFGMGTGVSPPQWPPGILKYSSGSRSLLLLLL